MRGILSLFSSRESNEFPRREASKNHDVMVISAAGSQLILTTLGEHAVGE